MAWISGLTTRGWRRAWLTLALAAQACLPILNLGLDFYEGWVGVVVYPGEFRVRRPDGSHRRILASARIRSGGRVARPPPTTSTRSRPL